MSVSKSGGEPDLVESLQAVVFSVLLPVGQVLPGAASSGSGLL